MLPQVRLAGADERAVDARGEAPHGMRSSAPPSPIAPVIAQVMKPSTGIMYAIVSTAKPISIETMARDAAGILIFRDNAAASRANDAGLADECRR